MREEHSGQRQEQDFSVLSFYIFPQIEIYSHFEMLGLIIFEKKKKKKENKNPIREIKTSFPHPSFQEVWMDFANCTAVAGACGV